MRSIIGGRARRWNDKRRGSSKHRLSTQLGSTACRTAQDSATAKHRAICELDLTELQAIIPPRGSAETDPSALPPGSFTGGPQETPARRCVSLLTGIRAARGSPVDYRHKPP